MAVDRPSIETLGRSSSFGHDLALSARAMASAPLLVVLTMVLVVLASRSGPLGGAAILVQIVVAGFVGVQRIWFLRIWRGSTLEVREVAPLVWRFVGRYLALAALVGAVSVVPFLVVVAVFGTEDHAPLAVSAAVVALVCDLVLTFVTPALAYTTRSVRVALRLGLRILAGTWPHSAWYVLTPGLVLVTSVSLARRSPAVLVFIAVTSVVGLWFKGAVAAFYLRRYPEMDGFGA